MVLVIALARRHEAGDVRVMHAVDPDAAHRVVHGREDLHRHLARILTDELGVHLENAAELVLEVVRRDVREVEVDAAVVVDTEPHMDADLEDRTGGNVTRNEVAVCGVHLLKEVPRLAVLVRPDTSTLTAARLGHETVLVRTGDCRRMDLDELGVADVCALLVCRRDRRSVTDRGRCAAAEHLSRAARCEDDDIGGERLDLV